MNLIETPVEITDAPLDFYKFCFPNEDNIQEKVQALMLKSANDYHSEYFGKKIEYKDLTEPVSKGLSILEIEILCIAEIEKLHE